MLAKLFVVLAVVACTFAAQRVTPRSKLPDYVDNMLHNNLEEVTSGLGSEARNIVHFKLESETAGEILAKLSTKIQWADIASYVAIAQDLTTLSADNVHSHYIFKAFPEEAVFRYAVVNLYKTKEGKVGVVFGQDTRRAFGIMKTTTYHDMKISAFGLPFESSAILHQVGTHKPEVHEYNRAQILSALQAARANQLAGLGINIGAVLGGAGNFINGVANAYGSIASAFKTVKKDEFKEKIAGDGFDYYRTSNKFMRSIGIPHAKMGDYTRRMTNLMDLGKYGDVQAKVIENMEIITEIGLDENTWSMNDLTFDKDKGGSCDSMIFAMSRDYTEMKDHLLLTYVKGSFKLTPHTMIFQEYRSYAGGIYESTNDRVRKEARGLTTDEVKAIHACMVLSALQVISDNLGLKIQLPELKTVINNA